MGQFLAGEGVLEEVALIDFDAKVVEEFLGIAACGALIRSYRESSKEILLPLYIDNIAVFVLIDCSSSFVISAKIELSLFLGLITDL